MFWKIISKSISSIVFLCLFGVGATFAATYIVNNRLDAGAGSLRQAITDANNTPDVDFIEFNPLVFSQPRTITLLTGVLEINGGGTTIINAPGANLLTIDAQQTSGIFFVNSSANAIINGVTITGSKNLTRAVDVEGKLQIINSVITENNSTGLGAGEFSFGGILVVRNCIVSNNSGAGIEGVNSLNMDSEVTVVNSVISGDGSFENGGGLSFRGPSRVENSLITGNDPSYGDGVVDVAGDYTTTIINTTISDNAYGTTGIKVRGATVNFFNSTNTNGTANGSAITARNSIFAIDLTHPYGSSFNGRLNSLGYNLLEDTEQTTIVGDTTGNILNVSPQLAPLADNGGATFTHALLPGSPAIDAGDPVNFPMFDGRGFLRPFDGDNNGIARTDIGAYEVNTNQLQTGTFTGKIVSGSIRTNLTAIAHLIGKNGIKRSVSVNPFGYFRFNDLPSKQSYIVYFQTKSGNIAPKTVSVNTTEGVIEF